MTDGEKIKMLRKRLGYTQAELGEAAGVSAHTITQFETGKRGIALETYKALLHAMGLETYIGRRVK